MGGAWRVPAVVGALCTGVYLAVPDDRTVHTVLFAISGAVTAAAFFAGPRLHPTNSRPWHLLGWAFVVFLLALLVRPWADGGPGILPTLARSLSIPTYVLLLAGLASLLRVRRSLERHAVTDAVIICLGAGLASTIMFTLPAIDSIGHPEDAVGATYQMLDVVLLLALVNLGFTSARIGRSFVCLFAAMSLFLVGDVAAAIARVYGHLMPHLAIVYFVAFALLGCAAVHPSIVELTQAAPRPVQAWSWRRLSLLVPALAVPFVLPLLHTPSGPDRIAIAVAGTGMVGALLFRAASAVTAYVTAQEVFRYRATHDGLTGLPNRVAIITLTDRLLGQSLPDGRTVWLFFIDLDGFKLVNDSWGHDAGDRVIGEVARRLRTAAPRRGTLGRLGGDEFVLALTADRDEADAAGYAMLAALSEPLSVDGTEVVVSASIGQATAQAGATAEALLRDADTAMYRAKADGRRRCVVFDPAMRRHLRDRIEIELALRHALARGELSVAYQPIVSTENGTVYGAEALIRWRHPIRGPIPPATFIPIAEEAGMIADIGELVLRDALRWAATWRRAGVVGADFWVSVNVSARQLRDDRIVRTVRRELAATGLPPAALTLEITESVMLDESEVTERVLMDLRAVGVKLVVDDFGTGFSALGYLRRHPVTGVKVDRSFVDGLGRDAEDEEIVRAVVAMSSALGLSIVAEGVECDKQREVLRSFGVTHGQGHLWGRAVDPAAFAVSPVAAHTRRTDSIMAAPPTA